MREGDRPNILLYFTDQQRPDTCGCYGQELDVTPNLDRLAAQGAVFENAFTCQPVCGPARAALQSGLYPAALGCYRNAIELPREIPTLAGLLSGAGYAVGYVGKWHLASTLGRSHEPLPPQADYERRAIPPERRGGYRDFWVAADVLEGTSHGYGGTLFGGEGESLPFPETEYRPHAVTEHALTFLRDQAEAERPFFLMLSQLEPHHQNDRGHFEGPAGSKERFAARTIPADLIEAPGDWGRNYEEEYADYLGCCRALDDELGRVIETLERTGQMKNTVLLFASDHGSHFKTRCMEYKRSCHDASIRVPLVLVDGRGGGFGAGTRFSQLVSLIDLPPTVLTLAGVPVPENWHGHALQGLLSHPEDWQKEVYIQISESQVGRALRTADYAYSVRAYEKNPWMDAGSGSYREEYLYDLRTDPEEAVNLIRSPGYEPVRRELRRRLRERMVQAGEAPAEILPPLPESSVDLGLNGLVGDFWRHEAFGPILRACLPRLPEPKGALASLCLNDLPELLPEAADRGELERFLKCLTDRILAIDAE